MLDKLINTAAAILFVTLVYSVTRPRPIDQYVLNLEQKRLRQTILDHNYLFGRIDMEHYQYETCKLTRGGLRATSARCGACGAFLTLLACGDETCSNARCPESWQAAKRAFESSLLGAALWGISQ